MRRWIISIAVSAGVCAAYMAGCGGDDTTPVSTKDASSNDVVTTPVADSAPVQDTGPYDSGSCISCAQAVATGPFNVCTDNGPPSSEDLVNTLNLCVCDTDAGCGAACAATCSDPRNPPTAECQACFPVNCGPQLNTCLADGTDAGAKTDAGDAGADASDAGDAGDAHAH